MRVPTFETNRLILKDITIEDAPSYQKHFSDYEVIRHLSAAVPWPYPADGALRYIEDFIQVRQNKDMWFWGIFLKIAPVEMIGGVSLWRKGIPEHRGFWLGRKFWGQGIMSEAVAPVNEHAFTVLGFEKLVFSNALGNIGSRRVKEKTNARYVGTEDAKFVDPQYYKREIWELTKEEWLKVR